MRTIQGQLEPTLIVVLHVKLDQQNVPNPRQLGQLSQGSVGTKVDVDHRGDLIANLGVVLEITYFRYRHRLSRYQISRRK